VVSSNDRYGPPYRFNSGPTNGRYRVGLLKRDAGPGVDGTRWREYEADIEPRLVDLPLRVGR